MNLILFFYFYNFYKYYWFLLLLLQFLQVLLISSFTFAISTSIIDFFFYFCNFYKYYWFLLLLLQFLQVLRPIAADKSNKINEQGIFYLKKERKLYIVYWPITVKMTTLTKWISFLIKHLLEPEIVFASVLKCFYCWLTIIFWILNCNWD